MKKTLIFFLAVWFACMLFMSFKAIRLTEFLVLPLGIALGWATRKYCGTLGVIVVICCMLNANTIAKSQYPMINTTLYNTFVRIGRETPPDAIINTWWDFGDWITDISHRKVIFDGQSQNNPRAYWMAKVLLSTDEEKAITILKRLNAGQPAYFFVDYTMVQKMPAISYLGNWDIAKLYAYLRHKSEEAKLIPPRLIDEWLTTRWAYGVQDGKVVCNKGLENSLFTILYFRKGDGLKHFKLVMNVETAEGALRLYQIIW